MGEGKISDGLEAVLFDFGGVMAPLYEIEFEESFRAVYRGMHTPKFSERHYMDIVGSLMKRMQTGLLEGAFWEAFETETGIPKPRNPHKLLVGKYGSLRHNHLSMETIVGCLKDAGIKVGLVSNTIQPHVAIFRERGLYDISGPNVFLSCERGFRKPDAMIWDAAIRALEAQGVSGIGYSQDGSRVGLARNVAFVDDNPRYAHAFESLFKGRGVYHSSPSHTKYVLEALGARF